MPSALQAQNALRLRRPRHLQLGDPDETCDWLVIGGGNTGLFGAIHGVELGMDTILLEKNPKTGGAGVGTEASQVFNDSKYLQESGSPCGTSAEIYHYFQMQNAWLSDGLLVRITSSTIMVRTTGCMTTV